MVDIDEVMCDEVAQIGAGTTAIGVGSAVGSAIPVVAEAITSVVTVNGMVHGGAMLGSAALGVGAAPILVIGGGVLLIGAGFVRAMMK
uniref:Uncharacterized protein n=1 Tax=Candidatus Kentrum sp. LFY TaxID=2126342 RepID=A0A450WRA2_9GAMM|nr:MAG: hypothetical protein BECKLFY1418C_GA0070996_10604 [Candidatus Kentron sp. LFY]